MTVQFQLTRFVMSAGAMSEQDYHALPHMLGEQMSTDNKQHRYYTNTTSNVTSMTPTNSLQQSYSNDAAMYYSGPFVSQYDSLPCVSSAANCKAMPSKVQHEATYAIPVSSLLDYTNDPHKTGNPLPVSPYATQLCTNTSTSSNSECQSYTKGMLCTVPPLQPPSVQFCDNMTVNHATFVKREHVSPPVSAYDSMPEDASLASEEQQCYAHGELLCMTPNNKPLHKSSETPTIQSDLNANASVFILGQTYEVNAAIAKQTAFGSSAITTRKDNTTASRQHVPKQINQSGSPVPMAHTRMHLFAPPRLGNLPATTNTTRVHPPFANDIVSSAPTTPLGVPCTTAAANAWPPPPSSLLKHRQRVKHSYSNGTHVYSIVHAKSACVSVRSITSSANANAEQEEDEWTEDNIQPGEVYQPVDLGKVIARKANTTMNHTEFFQSITPTVLKASMKKRNKHPISGEIQERQLVYYDLETTGLGRNCHILQLSARAGTRNFDIYITPHREIDPVASRVTGITYKDGIMYHYKRVVTDVNIHVALRGLCAFLRPCQGAILVSHNNFTFDSKVLLRTAKTCNQLTNMQRVVAGFVDTLPLCRSMLPKLSSYKLQNVYEYVIGGTYNAHNATSDVAAMVKILKKIAPTMVDYQQHSICWDSAADL